MPSDKQKIIDTIIEMVNEKGGYFESLKPRQKKAGNYGVGNIHNYSGGQYGVGNITNYSGGSKKRSGKFGKLVGAYMRKHKDVTLGEASREVSKLYRR